MAKEKKITYLILSVSKYLISKYEHSAKADKKIVVGRISTDEALKTKIKLKKIPNFLFSYFVFLKNAMKNKYAKTKPIIIMPTMYILRAAYTGRPRRERK